jgi:CRP-like cAMP-binding protein
MSTIRSPDDLYGLLFRVNDPVQYATGDVIFEQGDAGDRMYVGRRGSVALKDGDRVVETVGSPGLFGELALIEREPRALTAVADTDVELVEIGARQFWVLVHETPGFAHLVMTVMARRLRTTGTTT